MLTRFGWADWARAPIAPEGVKNQCLQAWTVAYTERYCVQYVTWQQRNIPLNAYYQNMHIVTGYRLTANWKLQMFDLMRVSGVSVSLAVPPCQIVWQCCMAKYTPGDLANALAAFNIVEYGLCYNSGLVTTIFSIQHNRLTARPSKYT